MLYEQLRHEVFLTRAKLESLRSYTEARVSLIKGILEELIPDTRGKVYSPKGVPVASGTGSLIFNTQM